MLRLRYPLAALSVIFLSFVLISFLPARYEQVEAVDLPLPDLGYGTSVTINYPTQLRLGTSSPLRLATRLDAATGAAQSLSPDTLVVMHFESDCIQFNPPGDTAQAFMPNNDQPWFWELTPTGEPGTCDLTVVIRLRQQDVVEEEVIYVRKLKIENTTLLGMTLPDLRAVGIIGGIISLLALAFVQWRSGYRL